MLYIYIIYIYTYIYIYIYIHIKCYLLADFTPYSSVSTVDLERLNVHWDYNESRDFSNSFTRSFLEKDLFSVKFLWNC